jgi:HEAT repeat protein
MLAALVALALPAVAAAQTPVKPVPPPAAPAAVPAPKALPSIVVPELAEVYRLDAMRAMELSQETLNRYTLDALTLEQQRAVSDEARKAMAIAREELERMKWEAPAVHTYDWDMAQQFGQTFGGNNELSAYNRGQSALSQRQYDAAIQRFDQVIAMKGSRADGALYWKAWAQYKLGRTADATATLSELKNNHKSSPYLSDAQILEAEVKRTAGQPVRPETEDNDDLKLLAIQSLAQSDPDRAIPLLQGVLNSAGSLKLKQRALYVLSASAQPQAHQMLVSIAKGSNPDLQVMAIRQLGIASRSSKNPTSPQELMEIYNAAKSDEVKRAVVQAFGMSGDRAALVAVISGANATEIRREGINQLASAQGGQELWSLYQKEENKELRMSILSALGSMGAYDRIIEVAKTEKDADVRRRAIRSLGSMKAERSGAALVEIYNGSSDADDKKAVLAGLANQNNADALITIARREQNFELKRYAVERLTNSSMAKNKAVQDFLMEIIK